MATTKKETTQNVVSSHEKVTIKLSGPFASFVNGVHEHWADGKLLASFDHGVSEVTEEVAKLLKELGVAE